MAAVRVRVIAMLLPLLAGCGAELVTPYPDALVGAEGQAIVLEDVEAVTSNPNLTDDQKRERLRDLGIEDEKLIDALLTL